MGTTVKERLEEYLKKNKMSARKFYEKADVANGLLKDTSQYLRDESKEKILRAFPDIDMVYLTTGIKSKDDTKNELNRIEYSNQIKVRIVTTKARAGFSDSYYADEYLNDMPIVMIESDEDYEGKYLAFEVDGDSMEPEYNRGDIVICKEIQRDDWRNKLHYKDWDFVIAHGTMGIMLKEITAHNVETGEITCHSLNCEMHNDFILNLKEVSYLYIVFEHRRLGRNTRRIR